MKKIILGTAASLTPIYGLQAWNKLKVSIGEKSFVPVMLTPYNKDKSVDYKGLESLTDYYLAAGARGLFANCLSSEMYDLSPEERLKVTETVVKRVNGRFPVVATGSFGEDTYEKATFSKKLADTGVDAVIMITSHFAAPEESDETMIRNLESYLNQTNSLALGTYECPSPYKRVLSLEVLDFLLGTGRLVYHKDTTEDIEHIRKKLRLSQRSDLGLYNAHIGSAVASLRAGGAGLSPIAGNYYPEVIAWVCQHAENPEKKAEVDWLQEKLKAMESRITVNYQLSSRYFLNKSGMNLELTSRRSNSSLTQGQQQQIDQGYREVQEWKEQLGI
ncbi:dihydrodipicolinate synthase family protein [Cyclobacterium jeungdonense]|uniref:Dihydrodipicolinate synthase family protein n=1 Tax=Cyclobacterium jeungdonense TaxID=708087 RepID=A0ABT8C4T1_9BACT|nr:dihydrodipicolinate synthase family protein [Cyclobacterium jeungdonense]MDN3687072.1 dihydrodipicolinate synthase family protein [Cyclobacterium jeungdonense]